MAVKLDYADPNKVKIGGNWTEVRLSGDGLDIRGLEAWIMDPDGLRIDPLVLVEQPSGDDTTNEVFPVVVKPLDGAHPSDRNIAIKDRNEELEDDGTCKAGSATCYILKDGINLY